MPILPVFVTAKSFDSDSKTSASVPARPPRSCDGTVAAVEDHDSDLDALDPTLGRSGGVSVTGVRGCVNCALASFRDLPGDISGPGSRGYPVALRTNGVDGGEDEVYALSAVANESDVVTVVGLLELCLPPPAVCAGLPLPLSLSSSIVLCRCNS